MSFGWLWSLTRKQHKLSSSSCSKQITKIKSRRQAKSAYQTEERQKIKKNADKQNAKKVNNWQSIFGNTGTFLNYSIQNFNLREKKHNKNDAKQSYITSKTDANDIQYKSLFPTRKSLSSFAEFLPCVGTATSIPRPCPGTALPCVSEIPTNWCRQLSTKILTNQICQI